MPMIAAVLAASLVPAAVQQSREPVSSAALAAMRRNDLAEVIRLVEADARSCLARHPTGERCIDLVRSLALAYQRSGNADAAEPVSAQALALAESSWAAERAELFPYLVLRAWALHNVGRYSDATPAYARALSIIDRGAADAEVERTVVHDYADNLTAQGLYSQAETLLQREDALTRTLPPSERAVMLKRLAQNLDYQGRADEAERYYRAGIALCRQLVGRVRVDCRTSLTGDLALSLGMMGDTRLDEAIVLAREVVADTMAWLDDPFHPRVIGARVQLAGLLNEAGQWSEAEALYRDAIRRVEKTGRRDAQIRLYFSGLAVALARQGRQKEALATFERAWAMAASLPETHPDRLGSGLNMADSMYKLRRELPRARTILRTVASQIRQRQATFRDFGPSARKDLQRFSFAYHGTIRVSWALAQIR